MTNDTSFVDRITAGQPSNRKRFLSEDDCRDIGQRLARAAVGGGVTDVTIWSHWTGHVRWVRNQLVASGDVRNDYINVSRNIRGAASSMVFINQATDEALVAAARRAERIANAEYEDPEWDLRFKRYIPEEAIKPNIFNEATYQLDAEHRSHAALELAKAATAQSMMSAGYIEVSANCVAIIDSLGHVRYVPYTQASYSVTVRDPQGLGSGWAGVDWYDWSKIDAPRLTKLALDKCMKSRNPVAIEPGRYTTILESQAVSDFVGEIVRGGAVGNKQLAEWESQGSPHPFAGDPRKDLEKAIIGMSQLGEKVVDERISIWSDPTDQELAFPPFNPSIWYGRREAVYHPVTWIKEGILSELSYDREYAIEWLHRSKGQPVEGGFRMSGGNTSVEEMISTTKRGILVTRFHNVLRINGKSLLYRGYTRDGLWLIEDGKISKPIKNMVFTESIFFALNNLEQLGIPQRVYNPSSGRLNLPQPAIVPPLKIRDFSFTALTDAI